jgi:hypothetical protein
MTSPAGQPPYSEAEGWEQDSPASGWLSDVCEQWKNSEQRLVA